MIKEIRESYNITRTQLCEMLDIPYRTLQDWETGKHKPPVYVVKMIKIILKQNKEKNEQ